MRGVALLNLAAVSFCLSATAADLPAGITLPAWVDEVGARRAPASERVFAVRDFGALPDADSRATGAIQQAIDACSAAGGGRVTFDAGTYLTGALFLKDNVHLRVDAGVTLRGVQDESAYPRIPTRVAGIEMEWPAALINVNDAQNVKLSGGGVIDGDGKLWWDKYWRMRRDDYEPRGLRWAADYDCERVRLLVVWQSSDVTVENLHLKRSGFWTVQVCYSDHVTVDGITVSDNQGPSTDGVNIDSSSHVLVQNCDIDNNDDCICLKSGRDWDGQRVARPAEYVVIRGNTTRRGGGVVSFGSETSGDIRHVVAYNNRGIGTNEGLRFKSAKTRGGVIEHVLLFNITMENVRSPFTFTLNWNPSYSYATLPTDVSQLPPNLGGRIPDYWRVMNTPVEPAERGFAEFRDITIANITVTGARRILTADGLPEKSLGRVTWRNIDATGTQAGAVRYARDWTFENVTFTTPDGSAVAVHESTNVATPLVKKAGE